MILKIGKHYIDLDNVSTLSVFQDIDSTGRWNCGLLINGIQCVTHYADPESLQILVGRLKKMVEDVLIKHGKEFEEISLKDYGLSD